MLALCFSLHGLADNSPTIYPFSGLNTINNGSTVVYLYNVDAVGFVIGANDWDTQGTVTQDRKGYQFKVSVENSNYVLNNRVETKGDDVWDKMFVDGTNVFVNAEGRENYTWTIEQIGSTNTYHIKSTKSDVSGKYLGVKKDLSNGGRMGFFDANDQTAAITWAFVTEGNYHALTEDDKKTVYIEEASTWSATVTSGLNEATYKLNTSGDQLLTKDGTNMLNPFYEYWISSALNPLPDNTFNHSQITGLEQGNYIITLRVRISGPTSRSKSGTVTITANGGYGDEKKILNFSEAQEYHNGSDNFNYVYTEIRHPVLVSEDGKLNLSLSVHDATFNWVVFKDLRLLYEGKKITDFQHYEGVVSEMGEAPDGLKTDYKTHVDDPRINEGVTLQRAHEYTHDIYLLPGQTYDLEPFSDFHSVTMYEDVYHRWYDYKTDESSPRLFKYATEYFNFDDIPASSAPRGFVLHDNTNGTVSDGAANLDGSRKHKFADGGDLVHVIYLCSRGDGAGYATYGEDDETDKQLYLQPGKYRISFSYTGWEASKTQFNFKFYKSGNEAGALVNDNLTPTACHYNTDVVYDEDNYSKEITITSAGNYVMKWSVNAGWSGIAFGNIKFQTSVVELEDAEGNKKGNFGGKAIDVERTSACIAKYTAPNSDDEIFDVIAIDVANALPDDHYIQGTNYITLKEPTLQYRHIFVIHNAKKKADELNEQSDPAKTNTNVIRMMCPENTPFQYRLENFEYRGWGSSAKPTGYYHKTGDDTYEPVYHYRVEIRKGTKIDNGDNSYYSYNTIIGSTAGNHSYGSSGDVIGSHNKTFVSSPLHGEEETLCNNMIDSLVYTYKCTNGYDAALYLKKPKVGHYLIRVYAINANDANSYTDIKTYDSSTSNYTSNNLILEEIELEVLPKKQANMVDEATMKADGFEFKYQRPENMLDEYGEPTTVVNFDNIQAGDVVADGNGDGYYKWPWDWESSSYGFGYDQRYDYNMYVVTNRSKVTPYKASDDIYDRLYADTNGEKKGFFLYANAATDPTRMVVLNIGNDLCIGSRIYVSAWINEFNIWPETANVVFSFKGVKKDGSEVSLNNYVSGYVPGGCNSENGFINIPNEPNWENNSYTSPDYRKKWMHIYYYFDPQFDQNTTNSFDHFIISLENNCTGSSGADYAIDDIRAFVCKPELKAFQEKPICNGDPSTKIDFVADFDRLLSATAIQEKNASASAQCYYAIIDKTVYEKTYQEKLLNYQDDDPDKYNKAHKEAYLAAVVKGIYYNDGDGVATTEYGWYKFDPYFEGNKSYSELTEEEKKTETSGEVSGINRYLHFPSVSSLNDTKIHYGNKYWIILSHSKVVTDDEYWTHFDPYDECAAISEFEVFFSGEIKIDGKLADLEGAQNICANQRPKIQIDLNGIRQNGELMKTENAYFDWYFGPLYDPDPSTTGTDDLDHYYYNEEFKGQDLFHSLVEFRAANPEVDEDSFNACSLTDNFTQEMKACIQHFLDEGMIALRKQTEFASTYDAFSEPLSSSYDSDHPRVVVMTAIPINPEPDDETIEFCLDAFQITIPVSTRTPALKNGDDSGAVPYPSKMRDVPLRIGLKELKKCCTLTDLNDTGFNYLIMPLRDVSPVTANVSELVQKSKDDLVYLVDSNDPNVAEGESGARVVATYDDGTTPMEDVIYYVGKVSDITAKKWTRGTDDNPVNVCHLAFFKTMKFREGYWYTIKFNFIEGDGVSSDENYDVCPGEVLCTIKVVPEYQMWTGEVDGNWNNDGNWRRVTKEELLNPSSVSDELITDATTDSNGNEASFVPADFTKVIIPATPTNIPVLYGLRDADNLQVVSYSGGSGDSFFIRYMTADEEARTDETNDAVKDYYTVIGAASDTINFDMASEVLGDGNVACRSWYDHTCDEIHFNSGAKMVGQQYLHYNKAWADLELKPARWYTVSMPLVNIVSGDFYLPTDGARQKTPLFEPITYETELNDRFKPAVYQRTWNAKDANVWHLDNSVTDAANKLMLDWSHVYNETNVNYSAGIGFSIKPDVSRLDSSKQPDNVLFRFPKADTKYTYYSEGNTNGNVKEDVAVPTDLLTGGDRTYRLADFTSAFSQGVGENTAGGNKYFLIGNPFICDLDMEKFFEQNTRLEKKYWMLTENGQRVTVMDASDGLITTDEDGKLLQPTVAPFQSFFVEIKGDDSAKMDTICPVFNSTMMVVPSEIPAGNDDNNAKTRAVTSSSAGLLRVTTTDNFGHESIMILADGRQRHTAGAETLFDSNLADEPTVYAVIRSLAMTIGEVTEGDTILIGITGCREDVELNISGVDGFAQDLHIFDALTGVSQPLTSNITLSQIGNGVRYYLLSPKNDTEVADFAAPTVSVDGTQLTITAPTGHELHDVSIHSADGICHLTEANAGQQISTRLPADIYIVRLQCNKSSYSYKLCIKE